MTWAQVEIRPGNYTVTLYLSDHPVVQCAVKGLVVVRNTGSSCLPELLILSEVILAAF